MARSKDLDSIAPDDPIENSPKASKKEAKPSLKSKPLQQEGAPSFSPSRNQKFRQRVYQLLQGKTKTSFSSFLARPKVFTFDTREDDEEIILVLRRHWFTNVSWILVTFLMVLAPILVSFLPPIINLVPASLNFALLIFWYLLTFAIAFEQFLSWYFNAFIITEERVVDIDFFNLIDKKISEAKISMIQDVTSVVGGVSQTLFNYGSVLIQTAAEIPVIKIEKIPNPNLVLQVLQQMRGEEEQESLEGRIK